MAKRTKKIVVEVEQPTTMALLRTFVAGGEVETKRGKIEDGYLIFDGSLIAKRKLSEAKNGKMYAEIDIMRGGLVGVVDMLLKVIEEARVDRAVMVQDMQSMATAR
jgi:hypothetical protein